MIVWLALTLFISCLGMFVSMKIYKMRYSEKGDQNNEKIATNPALDSPSRNTRSKGIVTLPHAKKCMPYTTHVIIVKQYKIGWYSNSEYLICIQTTVFVELLKALLKLSKTSPN